MVTRASLCKLVALLLIVWHSNTSQAITVRFTNLKCKVVDKSFGTINFCILKVKSRGVIALTTSIEPFKFPINDLTMRFSMWKKANGYAPFLYNVSVNFCSFIKNRQRSPVVKVFLDVVWDSINFNHSCPYNHDLIIRDLVVDTRHYNLLPLPTGEYLVIVSVVIKSRVRTQTQTYFSIVE